MFNRAGENVGDCLDPPMRVPGKPGKIMGRSIAAKIIQKKEWIIIGSIAEAESPPEVDARSLHGRLGFH
jgi:hypothetical protein